MEQKQKLFVMLSRVPFPLDKGDKLRAYHQLKVLSDKYEVYLSCLTDQKVDDATRIALSEVSFEYRIYPLNKWVIFWNLCKGLVSQKPIQIHYFYQNRIHRKIQNEIERIQPDFIYCQLIRVAEYVKDYHHIPKTLDYMDAFSMGMKRRRDAGRGLTRFLTNIEYQRLKQYENRIFDYFDHHTIISEQDRAHIPHPNHEEIQIVKNGIDASFFNFNYQGEVLYDFVFVGNLSYAPNIACCEYILEELMPRLLKLNPTIKGLFAGTSPHEKIISKAKNYPQITISGWMPDIKNAYASAKICIAPLFIGTGLQNKLLEAMAIGVPCVTTSMANNALNATPQKEILIADTATAFIEQMEFLWTHEEEKSQLVKAANVFVKKQFNWKTSTEKIPF
ncbi:hypothetical protein DNU06_01250 [Putridiphycobacter roseus]|uniref:Glycosyltransferase n=1 Tax=Putridiphycobacter roseus TaxID=2219161 RepID=A0A2W1NUN8_9FLAO|nr:glycosyltransferase [Putridiphycobacter roseus]PZE18488.1 hypothetical protein DNU06_01250 [Putridiphycobacter roseus]